ncbi:acyl-ACP--UDP-N-acetylglucosamine O-acyltransferase [Oceanomicrobium pacificus]|uniref:Acyl-[acyl-carrier-protein]--UDP-N-acetylglucosamine O-acyltransferase n=1 Tax=Oceanomicrobium pacificus TaxID=2692916 RepID=A0A6B0TMS4_9RHOB|nr:acyl-ACP--UDP-N-acetylglucosamine O-acyltransferase [Oceanomicrobium pacificus]MXU65827.1 acyl-ACP--UDP-N-acetylglucosamine O-acyltransferase [Oceanomicrobium pacificus]
MSIDQTAQIHPTAIVEEGARIGAGVVIGPYCHVGPQVVLADGVELISHVVVAGDTSVGEKTRIWPFASIGHQPQDLKFRGEKTRLEIGARNMIREHVTMNPGTEGGGGLTRVGDDSLYMMGVHVGHDCMLGNRLVVANHTSVSGHVTVEDDVIIGGQAGVHQFCRIGRGAMVGGKTGLVADLIPFGMATGNRGALAGLNLVGLKRKGAPKDQINGLRAAYSEIFSGEGTVQDRARKVAEARADNPLVVEVTQFILSDTARHLTVPD